MCRIESTHYTCGHDGVAIAETCQYRTTNLNCVTFRVVQLQSFETCELCSKLDIEEPAVKISDDESSRSSQSNTSQGHEEREHVEEWARINDSEQSHVKEWAQPNDLEEVHIVTEESSTTDTDQDSSESFWSLVERAIQKVEDMRDTGADETMELSSIAKDFANSMPEASPLSDPAVIDALYADKDFNESYGGIWVYLSTTGKKTVVGAALK